MTSVINRLAYTQLGIKAIAAGLLFIMHTPIALLLLYAVDVLYLQFERNARGVTEFKIPVVTVIYYIALIIIQMGW